MLGMLPSRTMGSDKLLGDFVKVGTTIFLNLSRRNCTGSIPERATLRSSAAASRASCSVTSRRGPRPMSRLLPYDTTRQNHRLFPDSSTNR